MLKVTKQKITTDNCSFKAISGESYDFDISMPTIELEDNSVIIFPGMEIWGMFMKDKMFYDSENFTIDDEILNDNVFKSDFVDPNQYQYEGRGINRIQVIELDLVIDGVEEANIIKLFRVYLNG